MLSRCPLCKQPGWKKDLRANYPLKNAVHHVQELAKYIRDDLGQGVHPLTAACQRKNEVSPTPGCRPAEPPDKPSAHDDKQNRLFGPRWCESQLASGPPSDAAGVEALRQEIALLEDAILLCDEFSCRTDPPTHPASTEKTSKDRVLAKPDEVRDQSVVRKPGHKRTLSALASQPAALLLEGPAPDRDAQFAPTDQELLYDGALGEPALLNAKRPKETVNVDTPADRLAATGRKSFGPSTKRRRLRLERSSDEFDNERTREATSYGKLGEHAMHVGNPEDLKLALGSRVVVLWEEGPYTGVIQAQDKDSGEYQIAYEDGDIQWHDLADEVWWLSSMRTPTPTTENKMQRHTKTVLTEEYPGLVPDSQGDPTTAQDESTVLDPGASLEAVYEAAHALHGMSTGSAAFMRASQLQPPPTAEREVKQTDCSAICPGGCGPSQEFGLSFPASASLSSGQGWRSRAQSFEQQLSRSRARLGSEKREAEDIRSMLLRHTAAQQANHESHLNIAIDLKNDRHLAAATVFACQTSHVRIQAEVSESTTHVVVETDAELFVRKRSKLYLQGLALGCWIVSCAWLEACAEAKSPVKEKHFEVAGFRADNHRRLPERVSTGAVGAAGRARMFDNRRRLFSGYRFFKAKFSDDRLRSLSETLIRLAGGSVVAKVPGAPSTSDKFMILTDDEATAEGYSHRGFHNVVDAAWVLDCVTCVELLDDRAYRVGRRKEMLSNQ